MSSFSLNDLHELCARTETLGEILCRLLTKHRIGDRVKVVKFNGLESYPDDEREGLAKIIGQVFEIKNIDFWANDSDADHPYHVTYELHIGDVTGRHENPGHESVYMDDDEIEPVNNLGPLSRILP